MTQLPSYKKAMPQGIAPGCWGTACKVGTLETSEQPGCTRAPVAAGALVPSVLAIAGKSLEVKISGAKSQALWQASHAASLKPLTPSEGALMAGCSRLWIQPCSSYTSAIILDIGRSILAPGRLCIKHMFLTPGVGVARGVRPASLLPLCHPALYALADRDTNSNHLPQHFMIKASKAVGVVEAFNAQHYGADCVHMIDLCCGCVC